MSVDEVETVIFDLPVMTSVGMDCVVVVYLMSVDEIETVMLPHAVLD